LTRAVRLTALERSIAAMRAARARWASPRWASPSARHQLGQALLRARRTLTPRHDRLIPATPPRRGITHASHQPRPCEICGGIDAAPFQRAPLLTNVWVWRCARHAFGRPSEA